MQQNKQLGNDPDTNEALEQLDAEGGAPIGQPSKEKCSAWIRCMQQELTQISDKDATPTSEWIIVQHMSILEYYRTYGLN